MINDIPKDRLMLYLVIAGVLPILFAFVSTWFSSGDARVLSHKIVAMQDQARQSELRRAPNRAVIDQYTDTDPLYIHSALEPMQFLEDEVSQLRAIIAMDNAGANESFTRRLDFLTGGRNRLDFSEGETRTLQGIKETMHQTTTAIEVNEQDLLKILALIEGVPMAGVVPDPDRPQLLITDFRFNRKTANEDDEVLSLSLSLLKREYAP